VRGDRSPPVSTTAFGVLVHVIVYEVTPINGYVYYEYLKKSFEIFF
jgi:hypothetical protein